MLWSELCYDCKNVNVGACVIYVVAAAAVVVRDCVSDTRHMWMRFILSKKNNWVFTKTIALLDDGYV